MPKTMPGGALARPMPEARTIINMISSSLVGIERPVSPPLRLPTLEVLRGPPMSATTHLAQNSFRLVLDQCGLRRQWPASWTDVENDASNRVEGMTARPSALSRQDIVGEESVDGDLCRESSNEDRGLLRARPGCQRRNVRRSRERFRCSWGCNRVAGSGCRTMCLLADFPKASHEMVGACVD